MSLISTRGKKRGNYLASKWKDSVFVRLSGNSVKDTLLPSSPQLREHDNSSPQYPRSFKGVPRILGRIRPTEKHFFPRNTRPFSEFLQSPIWQSDCARTCRSSATTLNRSYRSYAQI